MNTATLPTTDYTPSIEWIVFATRDRGGADAIAKTTPAAAETARRAAWLWDQIFPDRVEQDTAGAFTGAGYLSRRHRAQIDLVICRLNEALRADHRLREAREAHEKYCATYGVTPHPHEEWEAVRKAAGLPPA